MDPRSSFFCILFAIGCGFLAPLLNAQLFLRCSNLSGDGDISSSFFEHDWRTSMDSFPVTRAKLAVCELSREISRSVLQYSALGCSKNTLINRFGAPRTREGSISLNAFPQQAKYAEENWIYFVNHKGVLCSFNDGICTSSLVLGSDADRNYINWKSSQFEAFAPGKTRHELENVFGKLHQSENAPERLESYIYDQDSGVTHKTENECADETVVYKVGSESGIWVGIKNNKCIFTERYDTYH